MFELGITINFEAAHCLPGYPGKCSRLHGHNWKVEVIICGEKLDEMGMLVDFSELKKEVGNVINTLDHYYLNELPIFQSLNPTAENIARYIYQQLLTRNMFQDDIQVLAVKVWESVSSVAVYREG